MTGHSGGAPRRSRVRDVVLLVVGAVVAAALILALGRRGPSARDVEEPGMAEVAAVSTADDIVELPPDVLNRATLDTVRVRAAPMTDRLQVTGTVGANEERRQTVTPLVSGRIERMEVVLGDRVQAGAALATVTSPEIAELEGALRAAEAGLAEAQTTLRRTEQLVELGAGAGKDLVAARTTEQAAQAQVTQLRRHLEALGVSFDAQALERRNGSVVLRAPIAGSVIERPVNPGAWISAGTPVLTVADLDTIWVIVNVPEARLGMVVPGATAEIRAPVLPPTGLTGRVNYVDARLDLDTRTALVRVEVPNPGGALKLGMFVAVTLEGTVSNGETELIVPDQAIQYVGERTVVFVATDEAGRFEVRDVRVGDVVRGARPVLEGLSDGEAVVTTGGFLLKSQLLKGQFGEDEELGS